MIGRRSDAQRAEEKTQKYRPDLRGLNLRFRRYNGKALEGADLTGAWLEGADLRGAQMQRADLSRAQMQGADLSEARMQWAVLRRAQMQGVVLFGAQMQEADLSRAQMQCADLSEARMQWAVLRRAQMQGAVLRRAQMQGADLCEALLTGAPGRLRILQSPNLSASITSGGALRFVDCSELYFDDKTDFRNSFADASVQTPEGFARPCQWATTALSDDDFFGHWRGWLEASPDGYIWQFIAPPEFQNVPPIPPPEGCEWKTGPLNPE
ncbi:MAG: pentapeptide repeat-containing protein [Pseudomonadota bacterium]